MQHGLIKNPKDNKPFLLGKNITITKSDLNDAKVKRMIFKKKVIVDKSEKKMLLPDMTARNLAQNHGLKQNVEKESQKYEILPNLMQRQIHQQNSIQKINPKPIFLGDNITITKSVPYKTGNLKNLLKPVKKATKNTRTESPKREILPDLPENSPKNSFETHENNLLLQKPNQEKTGLIGNDIIILKSEPGTKVNQFENNSLMSVKKKHPEEQPRKIESKNQIPSVHDKKRPSDAKKPHKCSICSFTCSSKQYLQNHIMKKHGLSAHERKITKTESPKHEILPDLPEISLRNSYETHDNDPLIQKPNHEKTGLIGNEIIVMKSEPDTKVNPNQFENNSLMPVKKTHPEKQSRKIGPKSVIESPTINAKIEFVNQNVEKESPKYERKGNLVVIKLTPKNNRGKSFESPENKDKKSPPNSGEVHEASKKQFKCDICNANFTQKPSLSQHIANFHRYELIKKHMKCKECDLTFNTNFHLNRHFAYVHQGRKVGFKSKQSMNKHVQLVHEGKKPHANISNALPNFEEVHESRMQFKCGPQGNKWLGFKCSQCTVAFKSKQNLDAHIQSVHEGKKPIQSVHEGKKLFIPSTNESKIAVESNLVMDIPSFYGVNISKSSLNKNTFSVHENKKPFNCNECGTGFRVKKTLEKHIKAVHEGKDTPKSKIPCTTDPQISNEGQIQNQVSSVHDGKKSLKANPVKKNDLDNNTKKVHDGKKPFGCNSCGKSFGSEKNLTMHMDVVHGGKKTTQFKVSKPQIPSKGKITNQIPSVHDKKMPSDAKKPHKCSICSFACSTKQYLQNHIMKKHGLTAHERKNLFHSVIKNNDSLQKQISDPLPFDCNSCWSRFASKPDLDQHNISAHQNKKQFKCNPCKVGFTSKQALNQHISSTHQGKKLTEQWKNQIASLLTSED